MNFLQADAVVSQFLTWLAAAPQGAVAVLTATLAALIAVLVALITQWILGRRARTELLTKKLEELYLSLNEVAAHNVKRFEEVLPYISEGMHNLQRKHSSVERNAHDLHKKIVMLVRLYFPELSVTHQRVFRRNNAVNDLIYRVECGRSILEEDLVQKAGEYRDALVAMEAEIIDNRLKLVKDNLFPKRYKQSSIVSTVPPPVR